MRRTLLVSILLLGLMPALSHAVWGWMRDSAIAEFTEQDWEMLKATTDDVLENAADGEQTNWKNAASGNRGAMKVIMSFQHQGLRCRRIAFLNITHTGTRGRANYNLCDQPDGSWKYLTKIQN